MLILGLGNFDRSDDAAGLLVARRLRELGVPAREDPGEPLALLEAWSGEPEVIVVDAVVSGRPVGTIGIWNARTTPMPAGVVRGSTHGLGLAEAIELGRALGRLPHRMTVYGIEGACFDFGARASPAVVASVEQVAQHIAARAAPSAGSV